MDPKRLVAEGYERIAERYAESEGSRVSPIREWFLTEILGRLPGRSDVLELGCGAGIPVGRALAEHHRYVGVDLAAAQLALARRNVPGVPFIQADLTTMEWSAESFDAVVAFCVFNHVPPGQFEPTLARIARWLRPGGSFAASLPGGDSTFEDVEDDWLGVPMYFAGIATDVQDQVLAATQLTTELAEIREEDEDGTTIRFRWLIARRL